MLGYAWIIILGLLYLFWMITTVIDIIYKAKSFRFGCILENLSECSRMFLGFTLFVILVIGCLMLELFR